MTSADAGPRRCLAAILTIVLLWVGTPGLPRLALAGEGGGRVPVLLIDEPKASAAASEQAGVVGSGGVAAGSATAGAPSLIPCLEQAGFVRNDTLFTFSPPVFEDFPEGASALAAFIKDRAAWAAAGAVDVIACGVSGLLVRLALEAGLVPFSSVRNLVLVSVPNRGSFAADLLKSITEIVKHESLLEQETRGSRYLPGGEDLPEASQNLPGSPEGQAASTTWEGETGWVASRARDIYEPLYAKYVKERFLTLPFVPVENAKETFCGWVKRTQPDLWKAAVEGGAAPPGGNGPAATTVAAQPPSSAAHTPPAGSDLSGAYYEVLAMEVAKNQYAMRAASKGNLAGALAVSNYVPGDWRDMLIQYGVRVLGYYLQKALVTLKAEAQEYLTGRLVSLTGYASGPASPMLRRLLKEDLIVNLGTSASQRFARLPANLYLSGLNGVSRAGADRRSTRYISISGRLTNPWSLLWPQMGPNDLLLEVDSAVAPPGVGDLIAVFPGFFSPSGADLLQDPRVQDYLLEVLGAVDPVSAVQVTSKPGEAGKRVTVSSWRPTYLKCSPDAPADGFYAAVTVPEPPEGWQFLLWDATLAASGSAAAVQALTQGGTWRLPLSEGDLVGLRLAWTGPANPVTGGVVGSAYAQELKVPVMVAVAAGPVERPAGSPPAPGAPSGLPEPGSQAARPGEPAEADEAPASATLPGESSPEPQPGPRDDVPLIRAVYRTKRTTLMNPEETYHERWAIDFGDGTTLEVQGSPTLAVSHTYAAQGAYQARAVSIGNRGEELVQEDWTVEAPSPGTVRQFSCVSIARVGADLALAGPKMWVTGKPANYEANLRLTLPPGVEVVSVEYDPGARFQVLWERAGDFTVSCAAVVKLRYLLLDEAVMVEDVFIREQTVNVLTTGVVE